MACTLFLFIAGVHGNAFGLVYEYYHGYQRIYEGETYDFYFDLVSHNQGDTNSSLTLVDDVAVGPNAIPFESAFVQVDFYDTDAALESVLIELTAFYNGQAYELYNGTFNGYWAEEKHFTSTYDISDTMFLDAPYGEISILASITGADNNNNFAIKEVGIGGQPAPVPEPATLLLLGTGLVGLAGAGRKKFFNR